MIDLERRKKLALHLRHLSTGQISNDDFEERILIDVTYGWLPEQYFRSKECKNDDKIFRPILEFSWSLYNDTHNHKLKKKHKLTEEKLKEIARIILFLHSDREYDWSYFNMTNPLLQLSFTDLLKSIITLGQHYRNIKLIKAQEFELMKKEGDFEYWPFKTKNDFEKQLKNQPFLAG